MSCSICLDAPPASEVEGASTICMPCCKHFFHVSCISKWFFDKHRTTCPMCRHEFQMDSLKFVTSDLVPLENVNKQVHRCNKLYLILFFFGAHLERKANMQRLFHEFQLMDPREKHWIKSTSLFVQCKWYLLNQSEWDTANATLQCIIAGCHLLITCLLLSATVPNVLQLVNLLCSVYYFLHLYECHTRGNDVKGILQYLFFHHPVTAAFVWFFGIFTLPAYIIPYAFVMFSVPRALAITFLYVIAEIICAIKTCNFFYMTQFYVHEYCGNMLHVLWKDAFSPNFLVEIAYEILKNHWTCKGITVTHVHRQFFEALVTFIFNPSIEITIEQHPITTQQQEEQQEQEEEGIDVPLPIL